MIIRNAELKGQIVNLHLEGKQIGNISSNDVGEDGFDANGGAIVPGLHDHHIHLNATAAAMASVPCGPPNVTNSTDLKDALNRPGKGWLRGVGYHHSGIQHRSGRLWILNSLALDALGISSPTNGRLHDRDLSIRKTQLFPDLKPLIQRLLSYGITGVTDVTPSNSIAEFENYMRQCHPIRVGVMGRSNLSSSQSSHLKLHYHETDLPSLEAHRLDEGTWGHYCYAA